MVTPSARMWSNASRGATSVTEPELGVHDGAEPHGHRVHTFAQGANVGHTHVISARDGVLAGAADPRGP